MRSMSQGSKKDPEKYDDPLGMDEANAGGTPLPQMPIPTGLSIEDDANRYLGLEFSNASRCPNCETVYEEGELALVCPRCDTATTHYKRSYTYKRKIVGA